MPVIDPTWWTSESFEGRPLSDILATRDFGRLFAFLRSRGWSVGALSDATKIDEYPIREIIKGKREVIKYDVIERAVVGLGIERHLCGIGNTPLSPPSPPSKYQDQDDDIDTWLEQAAAIDERMLATLAQQTNHIRVADRMLGSNVSDLQLRGHLDTLASLRSFSLRPQIRERLADLYCDAAALAGWVALDLGDAARSWRYHVAARDAGRETGSTTALAHALAQQAYVLVDIGRNADARQLAEHAISVAGTAVPPVLLAWLHAVVGEIGAIGGDSGASRAHFDRATHLLPNDPRDPSLPYIMLDEYHLSRWRGTASARLGDGESTDALHYALSGMDATFIRAKAQLHVDLAHSLVAARHEDEALVQIEQAKLLAARVGSIRQRRRAVQLESFLHEAA